MAVLVVEVGQVDQHPNLEDQQHKHLLELLNMVAVVDREIEIHISQVVAEAEAGAEAEAETMTKAAQEQTVMVQAEMLVQELQSIKFGHNPLELENFIMDIII